MYIVRDSVIQNYFSLQLSQFADALLKKKSIFLCSQDLDPTFFVNYFFSNEGLKRRTLKRYTDDFIFVSIPEYENIDEEFDLNFLNLLLQSDSSLDSSNFFELQEKLVSTEKVLVIYSASFKSEYQKLIFSYKYYLGNHIEFVFPTKERKQTDDFTVIDFPLHITESVVRDRVQSLGFKLNENEILEIVNAMNGDIEAVDESIMKYLYKRSTVTLSDNTDLQPETQNNEVEKRESIQEAQEIQGQSENESKDVMTEEKQVAEEEPAERVLELEREQQEPPKVSKIISTQKSVSSDSNNILQLTEREQRVYDALLSNKFLSRDAFSEIIWGDEASIKSNPDAIDQIISRMRRKFVKAGFDKKYITSRKGEGIVLNE
jgi:DNA-binding winged helix-turn-helix (wHTH) protein